MRNLLGTGDDGSRRDVMEDRADVLRRRGARAYRSLERVLQGLGIAPPPRAARPPERRVAAGEGTVARSEARRSLPPEATKFDLGTGIQDARATPVQIPWGYGQDRVTAMAVDPLRLYVYWEVTDEAIAAARRGLGPAGEGAWLNLRVYDVSQRIFDGTNAHSYFDHRVERWDRQWFFAIGKPTSTACVEVGLKSIEGFFVRIARSGRVDFPPCEPAPPAGVEWMTVRGARVERAGAPAPEQHAAARREPASRREAPREDGGAAGHGHRAGTGARTDPLRAAGGEREWRWRGAIPAWHEARRTGQWIGDVQRSSWEAGPFPSPIAVPGVVEERHVGPIQVYSSERGTRVVQGPWEVVIRGLSAWAERRVLGCWEVVRQWSSESSRRTTTATRQEETPIAPRAMAGSEAVLLPGASERRYGGASELRLSGASELHWLGASELRYRGASESLYAGASERRLGGASERRFGGASEWALGGASERRLGGASEWAVAGASERRLAAPPSGSWAQGKREAGGAAVRPPAATEPAREAREPADRPRPPRW